MFTTKHTKITKFFFNLTSLCVLRALRGDISLLSALCAFARIIFYPIFDPYRAKTAKAAKKTFLILFLGVLCPVEYSHGRGVNVALVTLFHGASPMKY